MRGPKPKIGHLLVAHTNQLFRIIEEYKFRPNNFAWTDKVELPGRLIDCPTIFHNPTNSFFSICTDGGGEVVYYSPAPSNFMAYHRYLSWNSVIDHFKIWLTNFNDDDNDLWDHIDINGFFRSEPNRDGDVTFTIDEQKYIDLKLDEIVQTVSEKHELSDEEKYLIEHHIDILKNEAKTQTKQSWKYIMGGVLISIAGNLGTEVAQTIYKLLNHAFSAIFSGTPLIP